MQQTPITKYLKFPFQFDIGKLKEELSIILTSKWVSHFNTRGYDGEWTSLALYAKDGDENNIFAWNEGALSETQILQSSPYIKEVIHQFQCPIISARLLKLSKGAYIKPHSDHQLGYEDGNFRIHVPITTHSKVAFILDDVRLDMNEGECWYTNVNYTHSVANRGSIDRVHLVVDYKRNDWSDELFFSLAPKVNFFPKKEQTYDIATMQQMIISLSEMNTEGAKNLIVDLQKAIQNQK